MADFDSVGFNAEPALTTGNARQVEGQVHPLTGILGTLIPPEVAKDKQATVKWIWEALI